MTTPTPGATGSYTSPEQQAQARAGAVSTSNAANALASTGDYNQLYGPNAAQNYQRFNQANRDIFGSAQLTVPTNDLKQSFYSWDDSYRDQFRNKLALLDKSWAQAPDDALAQKWQSLVDQSNAYLKSGRSLSPWDILDRDVSDTSRALKNTAPTTTTATETAANYTSALDAQALFTQAAQSLLGRKPTVAEVTNFQNLLKSNEAANPVTTTKTTTTDAAGNSTSQSTQTGGLSAGAQQLLAQQQAESSSDYGEHQAATTLMNWLMGATSGG